MICSDISVALLSRSRFKILAVHCMAYRLRPPGSMTGGTTKLAELMYLHTVRTQLKCANYWFCIKLRLSIEILERLSEALEMSEIR